MTSVTNTMIQGKQYFDKSCDRIASCLDNNLCLYKVVLVSSHIFRSMMMASCFKDLTAAGSVFVAGALSLSHSILYRASVERFCIFRFTMPSLFGSVAILASKKALASLASQKAFLTLGSTLTFGFALVSLASYLVTIIYISHKDIEELKEKRLSGTSSCCV